MAVYANLTADQGSEFGSTITVEDPTGGVFPLAGYTARGHVRKTHSSLTHYSLNPTITYPSSGQINLTISSATTATMKPGRYVYDVEIVDGDGKRTRVVEGQFEITPGVTRV
jgi:hypothetical protein